MELRQYLQVIRRWSWFILAVTIIGGVVTFAVSSFMTPRYMASTIVLVNQGRPTRDTPSLEALQVRSQVARTVIELLYQRPILEQTIANLSLPTDTETLAEALQIGFVGRSDLIEVKVSDSSPTLASDIANEMVRVFNAKEAALIANPYAANNPSLHVVKLAIPEPRPVSPRPLQYGLLAAIASGLLATLGVLVFNYFDRTVRTTADVAFVTSLPALAEIPQLRGSHMSDKLVTQTDADSAVAEQYRMIRARIESFSTKHPLRTILVTSSLPREGKSTVAANLAIALAQTGLRVVLLDADLRRGVQHQLFNKPEGYGLTTIMQRQDQDNVSNYLLTTDVQNLHLLPAGPAFDNPAMIFASRDFTGLLDNLYKLADVVVLDSSSLLSVADAQLLLYACDATVLVVEANQVKSDALRKACGFIDESTTYGLGFVLNRMPSVQITNYYATTARSWGGRLPHSRYPLTSPDEARLADAFSQTSTETSEMPISNQRNANAG